MKLSYPEWEKTVCMEEQDIPVISMENPLSVSYTHLTLPTIA